METKRTRWQSGLHHPVSVYAKQVTAGKLREVVVLRDEVSGQAVAVQRGQDAHADEDGSQGAELLLQGGRQVVRRRQLRRCRGLDLPGLPFRQLCFGVVPAPAGLEDCRRQHPTMKPVRLFGYLIANSTLPGAAVLDLFAGSGTTAIACEQLGRRACLMELDPRFVDVIIDRWEKATGEKAMCSVWPWRQGSCRHW